MNTPNDEPTTPDEAEPATLVAAVNALRHEYVANTGVMREIRSEMNGRFRIQRLWQVVLAVVVILAVLVSYNLRSVDQRRERYRRVDQRATLLQGCERANDQRATLREVINLSVRTSPIPPDLNPDLVELYQQGQARTEALRISLLALPGVQPVDCDAAYPIPA